MTARVAVLASGGGSNLQAILDHFATLGARAPGVVALVVSDRSKAYALERARNAGATAEHVPSSAPPATLSALLARHRIDVIALAGYLRFVPNDVTRAFRGKIINVHPALLPAFGGPGMYGHHVHEAVLKAGVRETGATVHFVDEVYDRGAIIAQARVRVEPGDTVDTLATRVLAKEHELYPRVLAALCAGTVHLQADGTVKGKEQFAG
ncbi:MAG TPA: phosphoribosylglycinamide formyltransferase [Gemmatimonadaceae bacterium]|nr:phosphoribosylglycinamide formyltransferase [Gemmatimonadaceae bacterium]